MSEANRAEYWMAKAKEARKLAIGMRDLMSRRGMCQLAASYDARAELEQTRAATEGEPE